MKLLNLSINIKTADIELVVRMEDTTSNRRLGSLNFNLSLSLFPSRGERLKLLGAGFLTSACMDGSLKMMLP